MIPREASVASQTTTIGGGLIVFGHATLPPYPNGSQRQQLMAPSKQSESSSDEPLSSNKSGLQASPPVFSAHEAVASAPRATVVIAT